VNTPRLADEEEENRLRYSANYWGKSGAPYRTNLGTSGRKRFPWLVSSSTNAHRLNELNTLYLIVDARAAETGI
jgi:hypothetical protein